MLKTINHKNVPYIKLTNETRVFYILVTVLSPRLKLLDTNKLEQVPGLALTMTWQLYIMVSEHNYVMKPDASLSFINFARNTVLGKCLFLYKSVQV